uniref:Uncharacterized protein n=1 Tax=Schistosoma mansoni TaxID=6183 RepID=A0A5K4F5J7_SCHMA
MKFLCGMVECKLVFTVMLLEPMIIRTICTVKCIH